MNIFFLDERPDKCAEMHNDKHCVKMILESAQMLSTAHRELDGISQRTKIIQVQFGLVHQNNIMIGCFVCSEC
mgnify:CR=1 FL=1